MRNKLLGILVGGALAATASNASAAPVLAIDLDSSTLAIDSVLAVTPGTMVSISVVAYDDGAMPSPIMVDTVSLGVTSSAPGVAAIGGPTTAGAFAGAIGFPIDIGSFAPTGPGAPLTPLPVPPLTPSDTGIVGYTGLPALLTMIAAAPDTLIDLATITAGAIGSSTFTIFDGLSIPGMLSTGGELLFGGLIPGITTMSATLTVIDPGPMVMPEPGSMILFGAGLLGLAGLRRRRKV